MRGCPSRLPPWVRPPTTPSLKPPEHLPTLVSARRDTQAIVTFALPSCQGVPSPEALGAASSAHAGECARRLFAGGQVLPATASSLSITPSANWPLPQFSALPRLYGALLYMMAPA